MKGLHEKIVASKFQGESSTGSPSRDSTTVTLFQTETDIKTSKTSLWSNFFPSTFSIFGTYSESVVGEKKASSRRTSGWTTALKQVVAGGSMRRLQERMIGPSKTGVSSSSSEIWLLGVCYKVSPEESPDTSAGSNGLVEFKHDFSSRIWLTYRKGFTAIGDSKFTSDVNWGCMLRSSQMLVAQALLFHHFGRSWRKPIKKPFDPKYFEILDLFGDSESSAFSIHNLLEDGKAYGLAAGSWVGPYAMCRTWENLSRLKREQAGNKSLPMAVYVVSGDEDGERGGAPVVCVEDASKICVEFCKDEFEWMPILLLVPLVLGLDKVNPRYLPSLWATFTFPQSLGIVGGKPGASTYIVGVQDGHAFYLDPHEVQTVVDVRQATLEVDTSSYHCNVVRYLPLDMIDPSLAIGFYCRDKDDFDDFCDRASKVAAQSCGAPLFTVTKSHEPPRLSHKQSFSSSDIGGDSKMVMENMDELDVSPTEDDWQLL